MYLERSTNSVSSILVFSNYSLLLFPLISARLSWPTLPTSSSYSARAVRSSSARAKSYGSTWPGTWSSSTTVFASTQAITLLTKASTTAAVVCVSVSSCSARVVLTCSCCNACVRNADPIPSSCCRLTRIRLSSFGTVRDVTGLDSL